MHGPSQATRQLNPNRNDRLSGIATGTQTESGQESPLASISGFDQLTPADLKLLDERTATMWVPRGTVLLRAGDPPDKLYLVLSGRFFVIPEGGQETIAEIGPGEPIGELAFFAGVRRTANVVAARDSRVVALTHDDYAEAIRKAPEIVSTILAAVAKRLARVTGAAPAVRPRPPRTVALLPIGSATRLPPGFAAALAEAVPVRAVAVSPAMLGEDADNADPQVLRNRLAAIESDTDLLLFELCRDHTPFVGACLSLADQLLAIAPAADTGRPATKPTPFELQAASLFLRSHRTLVVVRDRVAAATTDTRSWLDERDIALHHHVGLDDRRELERLGRFLSGSALGLVLGGGAALGCAHLGVAKALQEAGTPIDCFGGTSVGAAMGAALAMGMPPDDIIDLTEDMFVTRRAMRRLTIPLYSLLDHRVLDASLRRNYAGLDVEDLPYNFFAVSASLTTNDIHVHRSGPVWEAVRASAAIPGVLPPFITRSGDVLVDGGIVDNLPIAVMRDLKLGPNVVVSVRRKDRWRVKANYETFPTRRVVLRDLLLRRRRKPSYPSLATIIVRGMSMSSERRLEESVEAGDLFVVPPGTEGVGFLDWDKAREVAGAAYRYMADLLAEAGSLKALIDAEAQVDAPAGLAVSAAAETTARRIEPGPAGPGHRASV